MGLFDRLIGKQGKNVLAHVLDLNSGYTIQEWTVGKDVAADDVRRYADGGELYVIKPAKAGQKPAGFVTKEVWSSARADVTEVDKEIQSRPHFYTGNPAKDAQYNYGISPNQSNTGGPSRKEVTDRLVTQAIGTQSVWYGRVFKRGLELEDKEINALEITFFTLSTIHIAYLHFGAGEDEEKMDLLGDVSLEVLYQSVRSVGNSEIDMETVIPTFQARFKEYYGLILELMKSKDGPDVSLNILMSVYEHVMGRNPNGDMVKLIGYSSLVYQTVADQIEFVKESVN